MIAKNNIIPFKGFKACNIFGIIFYKGTYPKKDLLNHESIHTAQMKEMLYIFFYVWYGIEWLIRLIKYSPHEAYKHIGFEKEADKYRYRMDYLKWRKHYTWFKLM